MDEKDGLVGCWWLLVAGRLDSEDSNAPKRVGCVEKPTRALDVSPQRVPATALGSPGHQVTRYPSTEVPEEGKEYGVACSQRQVIESLSIEDSGDAVLDTLRGHLDIVLEHSERGQAAVPAKPKLPVDVSQPDGHKEDKPGESAEVRLA